MNRCPHCFGSKFQLCKIVDLFYGILSIQIQDGEIMSYTKGGYLGEEELELQISCKSCGKILEFHEEYDNNE